MHSINVSVNEQSPACLINAESYYLVCEDIISSDIEY